MGQGASEHESSEDSVSRRRVLQGIGVGSAAVSGGAGLTGLNIGVLGDSHEENGSSPSCPTGQVLHAKYEVTDNGEFELSKGEGRGDVLEAIDDDDGQLVDFTDIERNSNDEILSFEASTSPYYMNKMVVKYGANSDPIKSSEAKDHFEFENPTGHAVSNVYFCKKVYFQVDFFAGGESDIKKPPTYDWEDDNLIKAAIGNTADGIDYSSGLTRNYDPVLGGALQDENIDIEMEPDDTGEFQFHGVAAYLHDIPSDPEVEESSLVTDDEITVTLAVYERTGPEGEGANGSFDPTIQKFVDSETKTPAFGIASGFEIKARTPEADTDVSY